MTLESETISLPHSVAVSATGCRGADGYARYAKEQGFTRIEVLNWSSSAGDWEFLVTKDGVEWQVLYQTNNYPRAGFSYSLSEEVYLGTFEEVCAEIEARYS